ncbi:hypothetical protein LTR78_002360 [Recurvomyces mirabilis]|uniref:DUF6594 domain-containing protein n=1 Tax=Recurvomyces mirabilis TaxID=574656 RepID=A0AAE0WTW2_9PEZI|nr:hypothetical protein LTR78_002360 [Recurvomyces mirabilis]KAK5157289.1 hypothetical protein LTS14_004054 [Recurvomyces mirabilis]
MSSGLNMDGHEKQASMLELGQAKELAIDSAQSSPTLTEAPGVMRPGCWSLRSIAWLPDRDAWCRAWNLLRGKRAPEACQESMTLPRSNPSKTSSQQPVAPRTVIRSLKDFASAYPNLAIFLDSDESFALYRRHGYIQTRILLDKQDQLRCIEAELDELDNAEQFDDADNLFSRQFQGEKRRRILQTAETAFREYASLLLVAKDLMAMNRPSTSEHRSVVNYMTGRCPVDEAESAYVWCKEDLVTLRPGRENAWLDRCIERLLRIFHCPPLQHIFCSKDLARKAFDKDQVYYCKDRINACSVGVITAMILFLLIVPIYLLFHLVESGHSLISGQANAVCFAILLVFTLIFSAVMSLFTSAKKHEILGAAAAAMAPAQKPPKATAGTNSTGPGTLADEATPGTDMNTTSISQAANSRLSMKWQECMGYTPRTRRYDKTAVQLLYWEDRYDDLKVKEEIDKLRSVLDDTYGFKVKEEKLVEASPNGERTPQQQVTLCLSKFVYEEGCHRGLLIIYYGGHGIPGEQGDVRWVGKLRPPQSGTNDDRVSNNEHLERNSIVWSQVEPIISNSAADVLLILDCCEAGRLVHPKRRTARSFFEFLGACSQGETTRAPGEESFTAALTSALRELSKRDRAFSTFELWQLIMEHPNFPGDEQTPVLIERRPGEHIVISHKGVGPGSAQKARKDRETSAKPFQDFFDLRFHYSVPIKPNHLEQTASYLKDHFDSGDGGWRQIEFLGQGLPRPDIVGDPLVLTTPHVVSAIHNFMRPIRRRRDHPSDPDPSQQKRLQLKTTIEFEDSHLDVPHLPRTIPDGLSPSSSFIYDQDTTDGELLDEEAPDDETTDPEVTNQAPNCPGSVHPKNKKFGGKHTKHNEMAAKNSASVSRKRVGEATPLLESTQMPDNADHGILFHLRAIAGGIARGTVNTLANIFSCFASRARKSKSRK